jgi:hypothetical protein
MTRAQLKASLEALLINNLIGDVEASELLAEIEQILDNIYVADDNPKADINTDTFVIEGSSINPGDNQALYIGLRNQPTSVIANVQFNPGFAFIITDVLLNENYNTAQGSAEDSTLKLVNVTQGTEHDLLTFKTNAALGQLNPLFFKANGLNISVAAGDTIAFKWQTPIYTTNPQGVQLRIHITFKRVA